MNASILPSRRFAFLALLWVLVFFLVLALDWLLGLIAQKVLAWMILTSQRQWMITHSA